VLEVLHEDPDVVAVAKPPGRLVIPGRGAPELTVREEAEGRFGHLWVVHRLDRGTSGVLVLARTAGAHRALCLAFESRAVEKRYLALVRGSLPDTLRVDAPLAPARRGRMRPAPPGRGGKDAATELRVRERFRRPEVSALVEAIPETGRTHQIRVHLAAAGAPLCFDPDYGPAEPIRDEEGRVLLERTPLHSWKLVLEHPGCQGRLELEAPLPADMGAVLAFARRA